MQDKIKVLMTGVDETTKGGMWTVVENYLKSETYNDAVDLKYIPLSVTGSVKNKLLFSARGYINILKDLIRRKPEIMHVHMAERGSVYRKGIAITLGKLFGCRIIVHMHGAEFQDWYENLPERKRARVRKIVRKADKLLILGHYWDDFMSTVAPKEKTEVVYNAVTVPEKNMYNKWGKNVLFLGVVGQRKGAYDLLDAFAEAIPSLPENIDLVFYGPDFEGKIEEEIEKKNTAGRIKYCGWLGNKEKAAVFKTTLCNVLPSYNEGLPMTILETMAFGIPNITTDVAAIPEAVTGKNGIVIKPGDKKALKNAIIDICGNTDERADLSTAAYRDAREKFSIEKHIEKILDIYRKLQERE